MSRRLPPLNALRAFEAAARHLSFTKAAEELNVTPAAVSLQVKALEEYFGVVLFRRLTRALLLTDEGQGALPLLRDGFDKLAAASEHLQRCEAGGSLTISVPPSFGAKWLVPRLESFRATHPEIDVRIDATDRLIDFAREDVDMSIRFGRGDYGGLSAEPLLSSQTTPVCSPALLTGAAPLREPGDLRHHTLLHIDWEAENQSSPTWRMWLLAAGIDAVEEIDPSRGPRFSMEMMVVQAAIEGHGVALVSDILVADDIAAGRLVRPFDLCVAEPVSFSYFIVFPKSSIKQPKVAAFRDWLKTDAGRAQLPVQDH